MGMMTSDNLIDKEKDNKNSYQLKIIIRQMGIISPEESQDDRDNQKQTMEQKFGHGLSLQ